MPKVIVLFIISCFAIQNVKTQIVKGNWLLSGNASFSNLKSSSTALAQFKQTNIQFSPVVGYFVRDKLALGLRPSLTYASNNSSNYNIILGLGPFIRYYFLNTEKIFNIFSEGSYSYGINTGKGQTNFKSNTYSISGGTVVYFNSSVGLELTLGYSTTKYVSFTGANNELRFGIGFQFHLQKDE